MAERDADGLLPIQRQFIRAFVHDPKCRGNVVATSKRIGRGDKRFYDWLKEPGFKEQLEAERALFRLSHEAAVDRAAERPFYEVVGTPKAKAPVRLNILNVEIRSRDDAIRVIRVAVGALKLQGERNLPGLITDERNVTDAEFTVLAAG